MSDNSSNNKRIARNTLFLYIRMVLVLVVSLFTTRIVLQSLGVVDYGVFNVVGGFVSMFAFLNSSMANGIQRFYNYTIGKEGERKLQDVYNVALRVQASLAIALFVLTEIIGIWYMNTKMIIPEDRFYAAQWVFHTSVISMVLVVLQIPYNAAIIAHERMDYFALVSIFDVFGKLAIACMLNITSGDRLITYGILCLLTQIIMFCLYFFYARLSFKEIKFSISYDRTKVRSILSFSGWNVFGSFAYMLKGQGLNMLLNVFFGPVVNAAQGVANMVQSAIQGFQSNIVTAFRPQLVQSYAEGNENRVIMLFYSLSKVSFFMLAFLSIPIMVEIDYVLKLWLGDNIPDYTIIFTILVLTNMVISSLNTPVSQVVHATGKMKWYQIGTSFTICAILPVSWLFLKMGFDATIVYWVSLVITIINQAVCNVLLKKIFYYDLTDYLKKVIMPCITFLIVAPTLPIILICNIDSSFARLILTCLLSLSFSVVCGYFILLNKAEKQVAIGYSKKIFHRICKR